MEGSGAVDWGRGGCIHTQIGVFLFFFLFFTWGFKGVGLGWVGDRLCGLGWAGLGWVQAG